MNCSESEFLPMGKLDPSFLAELINEFTIKTESVLIGSGIGIDATVIDRGDHYLIAKTDPITFVAEDIGYYAININANDIACMGGIPKWFLATLLLPENVTTKEMVRTIFRQLHAACMDKNIAFCGGHTEVSCGLDRPILIGQMLGEAAKNALINNQQAIPGDDIILTKGIAIEAVSIIARQKRKQLETVLSQDFVENCSNFIYKPGISVMDDAQLAAQTGGVHAMHDPTEGGLAMGLHELSLATDCGVKVFFKEILILPEAKLLCDMYGIDPIGVIASGALLIAADRKKSADIIDALKRNAINARIIGKLMAREYGVKIITEEGEIDLPEFPQDEIIRIFR